MENGLFDCNQINEGRGGSAGDPLRHVASSVKRDKRVCGVHLSGGFGKWKLKGGGRDGWRNRDRWSGRLEEDGPRGS